MRIERELLTTDGERVVVYLDPPERCDRGHEFGCRIGLEGAGIDRSTIIYGMDSMQAMLLAIRHLNGFVSRASQSLHPRRLKWELGGGEGDFGLTIEWNGPTG